MSPESGDTSGAEALARTIDLIDHASAEDRGRAGISAFGYASGTRLSLRSIGVVAERCARKGASLNADFCFPPAIC